MAVGFGGYTYLSSSRPMRTVLDTDIARMLPKTDIIERKMIDDAVAKYIRNDIKTTEKLVKEKETMANTKFRVGDKVRIKLTCYAGSEAEVVYVSNMFGRSGYKLKIDGVLHLATWRDDELELVEPKTFTKADLKDGMVVEYRNGRRRLVLNEKFIGENGHTHFDDFNDDLTHAKDGPSLFGARFQDFDIVKVYSTAACYTKYLFDDDELVLIWERKEEKPKYKVDDRVKVKDDLSGKFRIPILHGMRSLAGKVLTVTNVHPNNREGITYHFKETGYGLTEDVIDCLVDYEEMTVSEIEKKLGYKVKIVDGE